MTKKIIPDCRLNCICKVCEKNQDSCGGCFSCMDKKFYCGLPTCDRFRFSCSTCGCRDYDLINEKFVVCKKCNRAYPY